MGLLDTHVHGQSSENCTPLHFFPLAHVSRVSYDLGMLTPTQLAWALRRCPVIVVAHASGVSRKTIYRLRHQRCVPTYGTLVRLSDAIAIVAPRVALEARREK